MNITAQNIDRDFQVYVADLAAYNAGKLHGIWIDALDDLDDIQQQIDVMLKNSPIGFAEEYVFHDYRGFEGCSVYQYEGIESVHEKAVFIDRHGELGARLLAHMADDYEAAANMLEDNYNGEYKSLEDFAWELTRDTSEVPEHLEPYIDYEKMARDMDMSGDIFTISVLTGEVHVFWNH